MGMLAVKELERYALTGIGHHISVPMVVVAMTVHSNLNFSYVQWISSVLQCTFCRTAYNATRRPEFLATSATHRELPIELFLLDVPSTQPFFCGFSN